MWGRTHPKNSMCAMAHHIFMTLEQKKRRISVIRKSNTLTQFKGTHKTHHISCSGFNIKEACWNKTVQKQPANYLNQLRDLLRCLPAGSWILQINQKTPRVSASASAAANRLTFLSLFHSLRQQKLQKNKSPTMSTGAGVSPLRCSSSFYWGRRFPPLS